METKFTKGKWSKGELKHSVWAEDRKGCIADCTGVHQKDFYLGFTSEEMKANALLISKAPEMFEMLKTIYNIENGAFKLNGFNIELLKSKIEQLLKEATEL